MNASLAIVYALVPGFPAGTVLNHIRVTITGASTAAQSQTVPPGNSPVVFPSLPADTYTYAVDSIDGNSNVLASKTGSFVVAGAPATISLGLPSTVTVTVA